MQVHTINLGKHQQNSPDLMQELVGHYRDFFESAESNQKIKQFWQSATARFSNPAYTSDLLFKALLSADAVDLRRPENIKALAALIEKNEAVQDAFLRLKIFGAVMAQAPEKLAYSESATVLKWRPTIETELKKLFTDNREILPSLLRLAPKFTKRLHADNTVVADLLKRFPEVLPRLFAASDVPDTSWDALKALVEQVDEDEDLSALSNYLTPENGSAKAKQLNEFYTQQPKALDVIVETNSKYWDLLNLGGNPWGFLENLLKTDLGTQFVRNKIAEVAFYLVDKFGFENSKLKTFLTTKLKYNQSITLDKALATLVKEHIDEYIAGRADYSQMALVAEFVLSIPQVLNTIELTSPQVAALLNYKLNKKLGAHNSKLEWLICASNRLAKTLCSNVLFQTFINDASNDKEYPAIRAWNEVNKRFRVKSLGDRAAAVDAMQSYTIVTDQQYWAAFVPLKLRVQFGFFRIVLAICTFFSLNKLAVKCKAKLNTEAKKFHQIHPLLGLFMDYKNARVKNSFDEFLLGQVNQLSELLPNDATRPAEQKKLSDIFHVIFDRATPEQVFALCHPSEDSPPLPAFAIEVLKTNESFIEKYFQALRTRTKNFNLTDVLFEAAALRTHADNILSSNEELAQNTIANCRMGMQACIKIVSMLLECGLEQSQRKAILAKIPLPLRCDTLLSGVKAQGLNKYTAEQLFSLFLLDEINLQAFVDKEIAQKILSDSQLLVEAISFQCFEPNIESENLQTLMSTNLWTDSETKKLRARFQLKPLFIMRILGLDFAADRMHIVQSNFDQIWQGPAGNLIKKAVLGHIGSNLKLLAVLIEKKSEFMSKQIEGLFYDPTKKGQPFEFPRLKALLEQHPASDEVAKFSAQLIARHRDEIGDAGIDEAIRISAPLAGHLSKIPKAVDINKVLSSPESSREEELWRTRKEKEKEVATPKVGKTVSKAPAAPSSTEKHLLTHKLQSILKRRNAIDTPPTPKTPTGVPKSGEKAGVSTTPIVSNMK